MIAMVIELNCLPSFPKNEFPLDEKYSNQVSRATSKEEMNVDLTPKKQKDFCKSFASCCTSRTVLSHTLLLVDTMSLTSEASSMPIDNELDDLLTNRDIESLSQELANRGPPLCEKQIR